MTRPSTDRLVGGAAAVAVQVLLGWMLLFGLTIRLPLPVQDALEVFDIRPAPPPPKIEERQAHRPAKRREGRAAPPALKAKPTEIVAPKIERPPPPPPIVAAPVAGLGTEARAGAAPVPGPGTGAGGRGTGLGAGGDGDGDGGGGDGDETGPRLVRGAISDSDYPRALWAAGIGGTVSVRYHVEVDGRATGCAVTRTSGNYELDSATCRLIEQRFRFDPARSADGRPVRSTIVENHHWVIDDSELRRRRPD